MSSKVSLKDLQPPVDLNERMAILYGDPGCMKSLIVAALARLYFEQTGKPPLLIWTDENLKSDIYGKRLAEFVFSGLTKKEIKKYLRVYEKPRSVFGLLGDILSDKKEENYKISFLALDSASGILDSIITDPDDLHQKSIASQWMRLIARRLEKIAHTRKIPVFLVAHKIPTIQGEWHGEKDRPTFTVRAIQYGEIVIRQFIQFFKEGRRLFWYFVFFRDNPALEKKTIEVTYLVDRVSKIVEGAGKEQTAEEVVTLPEETE